MPRGTLLEIGPGFGTFAALASGSGAFDRVVAIEPTPEMAAACRERGVEVVQKRIEDAKSEVTAASVACAFEVIEHLFDPSRFVRAVHGMLAPGGLMVLSCPNGEGFDIAMLGAGSLAVDAEHVNLFNPASLRRLVEAAGFEVLIVHDARAPGRRVRARGGAQGRSSARSIPASRAGRGMGAARLAVPDVPRRAGLSSHMWLVARRHG